MDERKEFPEKPYHEVLERNKVAGEIVDFVFKKYKMTALEITIILELAKKQGLSRFTLPQNAKIHCSDAETVSTVDQIKAAAEIVEKVGLKCVPDFVICRK